MDRALWSFPSSSEMPSPVGRASQNCLKRGEAVMKTSTAFLTIPCFCFVLVGGIAGAQQSASPKPDLIYIPADAAKETIPAERGRAWKVIGEDTAGAYALVEGTLQAGAGPEPHRHSREDEGFYVVDGQVEFKVGKRTIVASAGSFLFASRGLPHTFKNAGTTPARYLMIVSPAGLEKFFQERNALEKELPRTDPSFSTKLKALNEKYGLEYSRDWSFAPKTGN